MAEIRHLGCWRQNAKTRFSGKLSNLKLWCLLSTYMKLCEPIIGSLKSKMAEIRHLALSFHPHFYSCSFHPLHYRADVSTPAFSTPCLYLLFRADISTPAFSTPAFSVPPPNYPPRHTAAILKLTNCITESTAHTLMAVSPFSTVGVAEQ